MASDDVQLLIRVDASLKQQIQELAAKNDRTLKAEASRAIRLYLGQSVSDDKA
jgi:predicted transcriptional regulator